MARLFGCQLKSSNGLNAIKMFEEKNWVGLKSYCMQDVRVTEQVYLKYKKNLEA